MSIIMDCLDQGSKWILNKTQSKMQKSDLALIENNECHFVKIFDLLSGI